MFQGIRDEDATGDITDCDGKPKLVPEEFFQDAYNVKLENAPAKKY